MNQPIPNRPAFPWHAFLRELTLFRRRYGHCAVPRNHPPSPPLAAWSQSLRNRMSRLSVERLRRLAEMGFDFGRLNNIWLRHFLHAIELKEQYGNWEDCARDLPFGRWACEQRSRKADLAPDRAELLKRTGFSWEHSLAVRWRHRFDELRRFHRRHGDLRALKVCRFYRRGGGTPSSIEKGIKRIVLWLDAQRARARAGQLPEDRKRSLATLGVAWHRPKERWERLYRLLADFRSQHGHCNVTNQSSKNVELVRWVDCLRHGWNRLGAERRRHLEKLFLFGSRYRTRWEQRYVELAAFKKRYGHCRPPVHGRYAALGSWVTFHRSNRLTLDQRERLNALGFEWDPLHTQWMRRFVKLQAFHQRFGHANVPDGWKEDPTLNVWAKHQRGFFHKGKLDPRHIRLLNRVGFAWNPYHAQWMDRYARLQAFRRRFGHANVPSDWREDPVLGAWVANQRRSYRRRELNRQCIHRLNRLGFEWNPLRTAWMRQFVRLRSFRKRFGHTNVPHRWKEDPSLADWTNIQPQ